MFAKTQVSFFPKQKEKLSIWITRSLTQMQIPACENGIYRSFFSSIDGFATLLQVLSNKQNTSCWKQTSYSLSARLIISI